MRPLFVHDKISFSAICIGADSRIMSSGETNSNNNNVTSIPRSTAAAAEPSSSVGPGPFTSNTAPIPVLTPHCDICWGRDGYQSMKLYQCVKCVVYVHANCYGIVVDEDFEPNKHKAKKASAVAGSNSSPEPFTCWACQAIGTTVKIRRKHPNGKHVEIHIASRPTECCLCSVDDNFETSGIPGFYWPHAMHPLFDHHGKRGRQRVLPAETSSHTSGGSSRKLERTAWVHTACAMIICPLSGGFLYGCVRDGSFDGDSDDDVSDGEGSINSALAESEDDDNNDESIHHFVLLHNEDFDKRIRERQRMKCIYCGRDDKPKGIYRIPMQCFANDEREFKEFLPIHRKQLGDDTCYQALHVGCAMYGKDIGGKEYPNFRRVYFYPGHSPEEQQVVTQVFCDLHAKALADGGLKGASVVRYPKLPSLPRAAESKTSTSKQPNASDSSSMQKAPNRSIPTQVVAVARAIDLSRTTEKRAQSLTLGSGNAPGKQPAPAMLRRAQSMTASSSSADVSAASREVSKAKKSKLLAAVESIPLHSKKSNEENDRLVRVIYEDVTQALKDVNNHTRSVETRQARMKYWKRRLNLSSAEFDVLWKNVRSRLKEKSMELTDLAGDGASTSTSANHLDSKSPSSQDKADARIVTLEIDSPDVMERNERFSSPEDVDIEGKFLEGLDEPLAVEWKKVIQDAVYSIHSTFENDDSRTIVEKLAEVRKKWRQNFKTMEHLPELLTGFKENWTRVKRALGEILDIEFKSLKKHDQDKGKNDDTIAMEPAPADASDSADRAMESEGPDEQSAPTNGAETSPVYEVEHANMPDGHGENTAAPMDVEFSPSEGEDKRPASPMGVHEQLPADDEIETERMKPRRKRIRRLNESKVAALNNTPDESTAEQLYNRIVSAIRIDMARGDEDRSLKAILKENKMFWLAHPDVSNRDVYFIWHRVRQAVSKDSVWGRTLHAEGLDAEMKGSSDDDHDADSQGLEVDPMDTDVTEKSTSAKKQPTDWSFLVVGKNYDPNRLNFSTLDTCEEENDLS